MNAFLMYIVAGFALTIGAAVLRLLSFGDARATEGAEPTNAAHWLVDILRFGAAIGSAYGVFAALSAWWRR